MKVLSLKEPYASLIKEKKKLIETRSFKTNYRGELYIHASINKSKKDNNLLELVENLDLNCGYIICKCNLVDCIYMTEEYINNMKKNNYQEYICGEYKVGRYAWILEDVEEIQPIRAKGNLNIWNYYNEFDVLDLMQDIKDGWLDKNNHKHFLDNDLFLDNYMLQTPQEVLKNEVGVCWDQVELERYLLKNNDWNIKTYFIVHYDDICPTHTFLTFKKNSNYYWLEHAWEKFRGIHEYSSLNELLNDVKTKFIEFELKSNYQTNKLIIYEYKKPKYHISVAEFYKHCENGDVVNLVD